MIEEISYIALEFAKEIIRRESAEIPRQAGRKNLEIHTYKRDGKTIQTRFAFNDLNEVMGCAREWINLQTIASICRWEDENDQAIHSAGREDARFVITLQYNNFYSGTFSADVVGCVHHDIKKRQVLARAYNKKNAPEAIMRALIKAKKVMDGADYESTEA